MKRLSVRLHGMPVSTLEQDDSGRLQMSYLPEATRPLSLSLPVREEPYASDPCEAYFGGLLPESEQARKQIARRYGANPNNSFSLLQAIGYDCAGAVSLHPPDDPVIPAQTLPLLGRPISETELAGHLRDLPKKPLFLGIEGLRLSLAGVQNKAAICMIDGQIALPLGGTPTTHILKPSVPGYENIALNEYLCLTLARLVHLTVPAVEFRKAEELPFLLIERYDRWVDDAQRIGRIHQEDFCQALGVRSAIKYEVDGGPRAPQCFQLMEKTSRPAVSIKRLLEHLIFNILVGNCDAHAKNYSLLLHDDGLVELAPVYDVVCTRFYLEFLPRMAMKIGGYPHVEDLLARRWQRFSEEVGIGFPLLRSTLRSMHLALQNAIERLVQEPQPEGSQELLEIISAHAAGVLLRFEQSLA